MELKAVSGITLTLLLLSMLTLAFSTQPVKASETIYIRADGSVDPLGVPISSVNNITYACMHALAPYIALTILLTVAAVTVGYVKKRKRNTRIIS